MTEVTTIVPIGAGFWKRIDGSLDLGFSYTRSSHIAQSTLNSNTVYRVPAFETRVTGSATLTKSEDEGTRDDRATRSSVVPPFSRAATVCRRQAADSKATRASA